MPECLIKCPYHPYQPSSKKSIICFTDTGKKLYELYAAIKYFFGNIKKTISEKGVIGAITSALQSLFKWNPNKTSFEELVKIMVDSDMAKVAIEKASDRIRTNLVEYLEKGIVK
jgi:hypothetical protein